MPDSQHPPFVSGATSIPRMLNRWLDKNYQGGPLQRIQTYITLPSFNVNVTWGGFSDIVAAFNFEAPNNFSLKPFTPLVGTNYTLCISYHVGTVMHRYILWNGAGAVMPGVIPVYNGQTILKNFRLEVWSTSQGNATQSQSVGFYTSVRGDLDYRYGVDTPLKGNDGLVTQFGATNSNLYYSQFNITSGFFTGLVTDIQFATPTGHPIYMDNPSPGETIEILYNETYNRWEINHYSFGFTLMYYDGTGNHTYDVTSIQQNAWVIAGGSNPKPTFSGQSGTNYIYTLPLQFPTNSVSQNN